MAKSRTKKNSVGAGRGGSSSGGTQGDTLDLTPSPFFMTEAEIKALAEDFKPKIRRAVQRRRAQDQGLN